MSDSQGTYAATRPGRTLNEIYGLGLGKTTGQYAWPYAACTGRLSENGIYTPLPPREAVRLCKVYCGRKRSLTGGSKPSDGFSEISRFPVTTTCEQQCEEIGRTYEKQFKMANEEVVEGYQPFVETGQPWYLIPLVFFITAGVCIVVINTPPQRIPKPDF